LHIKKLAETHSPNMHETVDHKVHLAVSYTGHGDGLLPVKEFKTTKPFAKTLQQVPVLKNLWQRLFEKMPDVLLLHQPPSLTNEFTYLLSL
jgi:hypothetical protein